MRKINTLFKLRVFYLLIFIVGTFLTAKAEGLYTIVACFYGMAGLILFSLTFFIKIRD